PEPPRKLLQLAAAPGEIERRRPERGRSLRDESSRGSLLGTELEARFGKAAGRRADERLAERRRRREPLRGGHGLPENAVVDPGFASQHACDAVAGAHP